MTRNHGVITAVRLRGKVGCGLGGNRNFPRGLFLLRGKLSFSLLRNPTLHREADILILHECV